MRLASLLIASCATMALLPAAALAADYDPPIFVEEAPEWVPVEIGSGWYLRGDVSYAVSTRPSKAFEYRTFDVTTGDYGAARFDTSRLSEDFSFGGGVGYNVNDWFRLDATLDVGRMGFAGTTSDAAPCPGGPADTACRSQDAASAYAWSGLINAYADVGTVAGFTPYVGAGAGFTYLRWDGLNSRYFCVDDVALCGDVGLVGTESRGRARDWRFTWALMAGLAYDVADNVKVDVGYRYRKISGGDTFGWDAASLAAGATGKQGRDSGFDQHQVRVGVRYNLW